MCVCSAEAGQSALESEAKSNEIGGIERKSTRTWAMSTGYDPQKLFNKVIHLPPLFSPFLFLILLASGFPFCLFAFLCLFSSSHDWIRCQVCQSCEACTHTTIFINTVAFCFSTGKIFCG